MTRDYSDLTRFQRMLVGSDGTVTHILEAYAGEPVEVVKLRQEVDTADGTGPELDLAADDKVLRRHVLLRGRHSARSLLYAEAVVALGRVDPNLLDGMTGTDRPIGVLLAEHRTETFREILRVGREPAGSAGRHFGVDREMVSRTYRIVAGGQPVILITEKFPRDFFRALPE
jgi:chorismate-pyruvate lyase